MDNAEVTKFINCSVLRNHSIYKEDLWIEGGQIIDPFDPAQLDLNIVAHEIDCGGAIISPGFIDVQINGGFGGNFAFAVEKIEKTIDKVGKGILAHGVTSYCPTVVSRPTAVYHHVLPYLKKRQGGHHGAGIIGAHVEGPFINPEARGAHELPNVQKIENGLKSIEETYKFMDSIALLTLAPELEGASEMCRELSARGIVVSLGHSMASLSEGERAVQNGASCVTHLYNSMTPFHHRDPGLLGLLASDKIPENKTLFYGLIADGHHAHPATTRMAYRTHPQGIVLVTDACSAMGLANGIHHIGEQFIHIQGTRSVLQGTDILVGGCASMISCIKYFWKTTGCTLVEALEAATLHPAQLMQIEKRKGTLSFGADADLTLLQPNDLKVISTWIAGQCVYSMQ